jgi:hypothetical protein
LRTEGAYFATRRLAIWEKAAAIWLDLVSVKNLEESLAQ